LDETLELPDRRLADPAQSIALGLQFNGGAPGR